MRRHRRSTRSSDKLAILDREAIVVEPKILTLGRYDVELTDVAFAARLEREPELRAAVTTWLAGAQLSALDWEQRKHERLLAA